MVKVLIVDDEIDLKDLINTKFKKSIKNGDYEFVYALNGQEALEILQINKDLNIILTDINMPVMDGLTLLANLSTLKRPYKAVVVSAYGDMSNIRVAMNRGASDFIMKPIDFDDFEFTIQKMHAEYQAIIFALKTESSLKEIEFELSVAHNIQDSLIPKKFTPLPNQKTEVAAKMLPAKIIGGDFYDFFVIDEDNIGFVVVDVSGKSISACLFGSIAKSIFRVLCNHYYGCVEVLNRLNAALIDVNKSFMFASAFFCILNTKTGELRFCNAGHPPPYLVKNNGELKKLSEHTGHILGIEDSFFQGKADLVEQKAQLSEEETLILFTDGIPEATNNNGELYGDERFEMYLKNHCSKTPAEIVDNLINEVREFEQKSEQSDDFTMIAIRHYCS